MDIKDKLFYKIDKETMDSRVSKLKIGVIVVILIFIIYFLSISLTSTGNVGSSNSDSDLISAYGLYEDTNEIMINFSGSSNPYTDIQFKPGDYGEADEGYGITLDIIKSLGKEIDYLENIKYSNATDQKYIDLILKKQKLSLDWHKLELKRYELTRNFYIATIDQDEFSEQENKILQDQKNLKVDVAIENIGTFLKQNPEVKDRLQNLSLSGNYLGEK
ncbi:hypothetical protein MBCUT_07240 [Methanobrevibacter cuticularis]|uniref:Uncharacterized protein n=1 Tax=Methanobrevibacter cuticularis TaxID=47311 RepID=A0A166EER8_9EURY|nr:hypothetical protein [Methanobrevibacter cuticularis]KZX16570.1 hypothetical protein MBCUT_07240 [Methanobrevibacter cuticularis]